MFSKALGAIALSCVCGVSSAASYGFDPVVPLVSSAVHAQALAVGDVTGDGLDDVVVVGGGAHPFYRSNVLVYSQRAGGGFSGPAIHSFRADSIYGASAISLADLDADGDLDMVVSHYFPLGTFWLALMRNDGGQFTTTNIEIPFQATGIDFMDVDEDGALDIITKPGWTSAVYILFGDGNGGIRDHLIYPLDDTTTLLRLADVDNDGERDLVYLPEGGPITVRRHENGGFSPEARTLLRPSGRVVSLTTGDFDGDGRTDIATTSREDTTDIYLQSMDGAYRRRRVLDNSLSASIVARDLDLDGRQDLLLFTFGTMHAFFNSTRGFRPRLSFFTDNLSGAAIGDLNNDGLMDIAVLRQDVSLMLSRAAPMENDLDLHMGLAPNAVALRVDSRGGEMSWPYRLSLQMNAKVGLPSFASIPDGCYEAVIETTINVDCEMPAIVTGDHVMVTLPFTLQAGHNVVNARAAIYPNHDLRLNNNRVMKRLTIDPDAGMRAPGSQPIGRNAKPARGTASSPLR